MNNPDIILGLLKYYTQFVKKDVLEQMFRESDSSDIPGYSELKTEVLNQADTNVIDDIDLFIFSMNEEFVAQGMRNSARIVMFVEYGAFSYDPTEVRGTKEKLAVHVVFPSSLTNSDNFKESLLMNHMHNILTSILNKMESDQANLEFCGNRTLINFPAEIVPVEPSTMYDRAGWMAIFDYETTTLI